MRSSAASADAPIAPTLCASSSALSIASASAGSVGGTCSMSSNRASCTARICRRNASLWDFVLESSASRRTILRSPRCSASRCWYVSPDTADFAGVPVSASPEWVLDTRYARNALEESEPTASGDANGFAPGLESTGVKTESDPTEVWDASADVLRRIVNSTRSRSRPARSPSSVASSTRTFSASSADLTRSRRIACAAAGDLAAASTSPPSPSLRAASEAALSASESLARSDSRDAMRSSSARTSRPRTASRRAFTRRSPSSLRFSFFDPGSPSSFAPISSLASAQPAAATSSATSRSSWRYAR